MKELENNDKTEVVMVTDDPTFFDDPEDEILAIEQKRQDALDSLAKLVVDDWNCKKEARSEKEQEWITSIKLYHSPLVDDSVGKRLGTDDDFTSDPVTPSKPYTNIVRSRCKNVISQLIEGQFAPGDNNWDLRVTPSHDPMSVNEQMWGNPVAVMDAMKRMKETISDQLLNSDYKKQYCKGIEDFVIFGTSILKGPTNSSQYKRTYVPVPTEDGSVVFKLQQVPLPQPGVWRVNPWLYFPDTTTSDPCERQCDQEVHLWSKQEVQKLLDHKGFFPDQVMLGLKGGPSNAEDLKPFDYISFSNGKGSDLSNKFMLRERHGPVPVKMLMDLFAVGFEEFDVSCLCGHEDGTEAEIQMEIWELNGRCIRISTPVLDGESKPPYAVACYETDPSSVLGFSLPLLLQSQQRIVERGTQILLDNVAASSGPQVVVDTSLITPADNGNDYSIQPWKVWKKTENFGLDRPVSDAISFVDIPDRTETIASIINMSMGWAEVDSGVSEMVGGLVSVQGQETNSATGMALQNQNALTPLLYKQEVLVEYLTKPVIEWMYHWNMQYNPDPSIKGDFEVDVRAPIRALQASKEKIELERLSLEAANNPEMASWIKMDALAKLRLMGMNSIPESVIRTEEERMQWQQEQQQNQQPDPNMVKAEAARQDAETKRMELDFKRDELAYKQDELFKQAQMEYQRYLENQETREKEAQVKLMSMMIEREIALINMATKHESELARVRAELDKSTLDTEAKLFMKGQEVGIKREQIMSHEREMALKREKGSGI